MLYNYLKTALRNFYRNKSITLIKIIGLSLGLAVTFFILIYVTTETSYNDYNRNKERIFRVNQNNLLHGWKSQQTCYPMRDELLNNFPEIEHATRIIKLNKIQVFSKDQFIPETNFISTDKSIFNILSLKKINGDFSEFSSNPNQLVISKTAANKYFGNTDVIHKALKVLSGEEEYQLNIIAVIDDIPKTSTIKADFFVNTDFGIQQANNILTWSDGKDREVDFYKTNWESNFLETYILLKDKKDAIAFDKKLKDFETKYLKDTTERDFYLQNIEDIYLHSNDMFGSNMLGDLNSIYIFSAIAFLVLLIACINYIILSVSQILSRTKEVGIRKILGAFQKDLFFQILVESLILLVITVPLAFIFIEQFRPLLEQILHKELLVIYNSKFIIGFIAIVLFVTLVPGLNIIYFLNRISPLQIIKNEAITKPSRFNFRKVLIVFQFIIFISLVVLTIGIKRQLNFSSSSDLGFNPENKIAIQIENIVKSGKYEAVKNEILKNPDILNVSGAMWLPPSQGKMSLSYSDTSLGPDPIQLEALFVDKDFLETFDIKLLEGKSLNEFELSSGLKVVLNKEAKKLFGEKDVFGMKFWDGEIIGVADNFRFHSAHEMIGPMVLISGEFMVREMVVNFKNPINQKSILKFKKQLQDNFPEINTEPEILSERFDFLYKKEKRLGLLLGIFSSLAIFIASIGLLGLTIFTTKKKTKNIAIRKVNGASSYSIWKYLISGYIKLISIAFFLAIPASFYFLNRWLQSFAYKTNIAWWIFIIAGVLALFISIITISWYSIKAARSNPVESLRYE